MVRKLIYADRPAHVTASLPLSGGEASLGAFLGEADNGGSEQGERLQA